MDAPSATDPMRVSSPPVGHDDRRSGQRYSVVADQAWVGWWHGPSFVTTPVHILDLGLRGALLQTDSPPSPQAAVWFCPPWTANPEWLEATVVEAQSTPAGRTDVRIAFRRILPYETFKRIVYGDGECGTSAVEPPCPAPECDREHD